MLVDLAQTGGAYIIFSTDDVAHAGQQRRLEVLRECIADVPNGDRIHVDFIGGDRVARWANQHLGVAVWLLGEVGRSLGGWRPAGDWSAPGATVLPYLADKSRRAFVGDQHIDILTAISEMRRILAQPGGVVRLVGLSGMGKTRLAEALFDSKVSAGVCLPREHAIYGDAGVDLSISAALVAEQLVLAEISAVIVVDNCPARVHGQLAEIVSRVSSRASLLTIDYDIESDAITGEFIRLENNSELLISQLLTQRQPRLTRSERVHLAEFAGGNARIALKIAEGAEAGDLSKLRDGELLDRLFRSGRRGEDPGLRRSAELASLVYAFYVEDADKQSAEDWALARIDDVAASTFYRAIATLLDWGVVQQRGPQRAVMPPPLANMLAAPFIRRSEPTWLLQQFIDGPPRLLASFARRLGELHAEPAAQRIAEILLSQSGAFGDVAKLSGFSLRGFVHLAPAAPEAALAAIERMIIGVAQPDRPPIGTNQRLECAQLLTKLAFSEILFGRAVAATTELYLGAVHSEERKKIRRELDFMFRPFGAPTRATLSHRLEAAERMLGDSRSAARECGMEALGAMIIPSEASPDELFGNRSLAEAWRPTDRASSDRWFEAAFSRLCAVAASDPSLRTAAQVAVSEALAPHADRPTRKIAIAAMRAVKPPGYWEAGWRRVASFSHYSRWNQQPELLGDVRELALELQPRLPQDFFNTFVCRNGTWEVGLLWRSLSLEGSPAEKLGQRFAREGIGVGDFMALSGAAERKNQLGEFGSSFAKHAPDPQRLWNEATNTFAKGSRKAPQVQFLAGILAGIAAKDRATAEAWLDAAVADDVLSEHLVALQAAVGLDERAVKRIIEAITTRPLQPDQISQLVTYDNVTLIPEDALGTFVRLMYQDDSGVYPAISLLCKYFYELPKTSTASPELVQLGQEFLENPRTYAENVGGLSSAVTAIAYDVLSRTRTSVRVAAICATIARSRPASTFVSPNFHSLGSFLTKHFPEIVLEEIVGKQARDDVLRVFFSDPAHFPTNAALQWLRHEPSERSLLLAKIVPLTEGGTRPRERQWSTLALETIASAARPVPILRTFEQRVFSSPGSLTARLLEFRGMVEALAGHSDERVRNWANAAAIRLQRHIARRDKSERAIHARFE